MIAIRPERVYWKTADLALFPDNDNRYEIIGGELLVTRAPHWRHQVVADNICLALKRWSRESGLGEAATTPGIIFDDHDNVIPDLVWISQERLAALLDEAGHLTGAPELVIEVLSPGENQERRDRQLKLKLYSVQGVQEYWICDRQRKQVEVYRRENGVLKLAVTLYPGDQLTSALLPGFRGDVEEWLAGA